MLDSLKQYLQTSTTPEHRAAITEAYDLFQDYGLEDVDVGYEDILMTANNEGESEATIRINQLTEEFQDHILTQMQIKLVDEATVSDGNTILHALKLIETTELNDEIVGICSENSDPIEALGEILNLVTGIEPERLMILFEEVSQAVIDKIKEVTQKHVGVTRQVIDVAVNKDLMNRFMAYRVAMDNQQLFMYDMLIAGVALNQPYAIYHDKIMYAIQHQELTTPMIPRLREVKTAVQLCAAVIVASDTQDANMRNVVMAQLERTFADLDKITPIYIEMDSILGKFNNLVNTRSTKVN